MMIEQFVIAYGVKQDRLRAILPDGFTSLRPVLRINAEIREDAEGYVEFNTAVEKDGVCGWLNIARWENMTFTKEGKSTTFRNTDLEITFTCVGIEGACPAEKDNAGCFYEAEFRPAEVITVNKEFCDCVFRWTMDSGAHGKSISKTLPAVPSEVKVVYPKAAFTLTNAATIPCEQVLGAYAVVFERSL